MNKLKSFFTTKGFYIALTVGVVAFAVLMGVYEYRSNEKKFLGDNAIDLNKPYVEGVPATESLEPADIASNVVDNKKNDTDNTKVNEAAIQKKEDTTAEATEEEKKVETSSSVNSDAVENTSSDVQIAGFDGESELAWPLISSGNTAGETDASGVVGSGNIVLPYSMDTTIYFETLGVYKCNPGVMLRGNEGENVYAVYGGTVTSVEETKEFGTVVTVDMGNGYEAKYGQLMNVCVKEGNIIASGQNIAEVGPVSSYYEKEGNHLYLAITKDGIPVNPILLIE
ncbi:MAG: M23 family metallopeptidase [Lachnospiraceae bacterium]|nr:M23 family metallopeptidase [Lachnospiraceae bacterium]